MEGSRGTGRFPGSASDEWRPVRIGRGSPRRGASFGVLTVSQRPSCLRPAGGPRERAREAVVQVAAWKALERPRRGRRRRSFHSSSRAPRGSRTRSPSLDHAERRAQRTTVMVAAVASPCREQPPGRRRGAPFNEDVAGPGGRGRKRIPPPRPSGSARRPHDLGPIRRDGPNRPSAGRAADDTRPTPAAGRPGTRRVACRPPRRAPSAGRPRRRRAARPCRRRG